MSAVGTTPRLATITQTLGCSLGAVQEKGNAALAMLRRVAMFWRKNVHDRHGAAGEILERRRKRATAGKQLALAFGKASLADRSDLPPEQVFVGDRGLLKRGELGAIEVGLNLLVIHAGQQHLACSAGVERRTHTKVGHAPHRMQALDEVDMDAKISRANR